MIPSDLIKLRRIIYDAQYNIIKDEEDFSHSWTRNAYNILVSLLCSKNLSNTSFGAGYLSLRDTGGTVRSITGLSVTRILGDEASSTYGIIVGTSNTAFNFNQHNLQNQITHGNGSGQLYHFASTASRSANNEDFIRQVSRIFFNNSGASITVREIGFVFQVSSYAILVIRDVLASSDTIPYGGFYKVIYTISIDFPS